MTRTLVTDWKDWRDVFESEIVIPGDQLMKASRLPFAETVSHTWRIKPEVSTEPMHLGKFMRLKRLDRTFYLHVQPTRAAIEALTPHVTFIENDVMNFEAIEWDDGRTLILCRNGRIIAEAWLAKINSITIPNFKEE